MNQEFKDKYRLEKMEQQMRDNAIGINNIFEKMQDIDQLAAINTLRGIIEYLQDRNDYINGPKTAKNFNKPL